MAVRTTTWVYDNLYRVTSETNELSDARTWTYSAVGEVTSYTDRNGRVTERDYDGLGRLIEERWLDGQTTVNTIEFGYDVASQLGTADDDFSGYAWTYDGLGRVTQTDNSPTPNMPNVVLAHGYDANSRRTSVAAEIGGTDDFLNTYAFDNLGRTTQIEQEGQSGGNSVAEKRVDLAYLSDGRYDTITRYADLAATDLVATSTYGYDDAGRLTSLVHEKGANTLADYSWTYDAHSRITQFISPDGTTDYTYDDTHQLTDADHDYQADESYEFDENGNRTAAGAATYTVGTNNQITSDGTYSYLYDDEGNRTRKTTIATDDYVEYEWDHRNRLTAVTFRDAQDALQKRVEYVYDMFNLLIERRVDADGNQVFETVERFVYDTPPAKGGLSDVVLVFDGSDSLTHRYLHGPAVDQVFADEDALGDVLWGLADHLNTVRDVVEYDAGMDTTSVVNHIEYDSFGNITAQSNSALEPLLAWTGRFHDPETGLQWNLHRWYDPTLGRWLSEDPIGFAAGDENIARYVGNAPTNFVDPTGLDDWDTGFVQPTLSASDAGIADVLNSVGTTPYDPDYWPATDFLDEWYGTNGTFVDGPDDPIASWLGQDVFYPVITSVIDNDTLANASAWELVGATAVVSAAAVVGAVYGVPLVVSSAQAVAGDIAAVVQTVSHVGRPTLAWMGAGGTSTSVGVVTGVTITSQEVAMTASIAMMALYMSSSGFPDNWDQRSPLDQTQFAQAEFDTNRTFSNWFHKIYKLKMRMSGGGARNPNMSPDDILDAFVEWVLLGRPVAP